VKHSKGPGAISHAPLGAPARAAAR
jgi:hypothetical protein